MAGLFIIVFVTLLVFRGALRSGGLVVLLGGTFDVFDGRVARATGRSSRFGSFYDSTMDRFSEIIVYLSLLNYYVAQGEPGNTRIILVAMGGALMVSYTRARAEALGFQCLVGFLQRPERLIFLGFGAVIGKSALTVALYLVAILSVFTAIQRVYHVFVTSRDDTAEEEAEIPPSPKEAKGR